MSDYLFMGTCRNAIPEYTPPDCTDVIQVIDAHEVGNRAKGWLNELRDDFLSSSPTAFKEWESMSQMHKRVWRSMQGLRVLRNNDCLCTCML